MAGTLPHRTNAPRRELSVLYVEDEALARGRVTAILERDVAVLYRAANGEEGLRLFAAHRPDIVVTDVRMPVMNGIVMARKIKELDPDAFLIVTTAHSDVDLLIEAIEAGVSHYILKPIDYARLMKAVDECLGIITLRRERQRALDLLQQANALLEQRVRERTAALERANDELRAALDSISRSQKEWQDTFDGIRDMIAVLDADFTILRANPAFVAYAGLPAGEVLNAKCHRVICGADAPPEGCPHVRTVREGSSCTGEMRDPLRGRVLRRATFPYSSSAGKLIGSIYISRDITAEREREMQLQMSERLSLLGQMASGIAHEINNPLSSISGCAESLQQRVRQDRYDRALFDSYLGMIMEEVVRCSGITSGMLSIVRQSSYEKRWISLNEAAERALQIIGFQGKMRNVQVVRDFAEGLPAIYANEGELRQVFLVIVTNALEAMALQGTLTVATRADGTGVAIAFSDTGGGIPREHLEKIFETFFTTKAPQGGTGLGLSIAHKIVASHGGSIEVTSEELAGSTFLIRLPVGGPGEAAGARPA
jgi:signal transduction histidine kinase